VSEFTRQVRLAFRDLIKAPGFTLTAIITLALGIGANTAIFTLVHAVMLKSLPIVEPEKLYRLGTSDNCCVEGGLQDHWSVFSYDLYQSFQKNVAGFEELAGAQSGRSQVSVRRTSTNEPAQLLDAEYVTGNYFSIFGLSPYLGRLISPADDNQGAPATAVLNHNTWVRKFGSDSSVVGSTVSVSGTPVTITGIAPPKFFGDKLGNAPDLWMPVHVELILDRENALMTNKGFHWLYLYGRLKDGVNPKQVEAQLVSHLRNWILENDSTLNESGRANVAKQYLVLGPGGAGVLAMREEFRVGLYLLLGAAGAVLLIACANLANLMLARGAARKMQTSIRLALGASRRRIIRETLVESTLISLIGGLIGVLVAFFATRAILYMAFRGSETLPISPNPSLPVLAFAFVVSLATGIVFGIAPAVISSGSDPSEVIRGSSRTATDRHSLPQRSLVIVQAVVSLVLLTIAGLLTLSLRNLQNQQFGFERHGRLMVDIDTLAAGYTNDNVPALVKRMEERLSQIPGVQSVGIALYAPQQGNNWGEGVSFAGRAEFDRNGSSWDRVTPKYFEALGNQVVRGRAFTDADTQGTEHVAVVNEAFVKKFFKQGDDPIGVHFGKGGPKHGGDYTIVGVVKDMKYQDPSEKFRAMFYVPYLQQEKYDDLNSKIVESSSQFPGAIILNVSGDPNAFATTVRRSLAELDANLAPRRVRTLDEAISTNLNQQFLISRLTALFGALAVLLASVGLYGVTAYRVARRTNEIGIRMALGASRERILKMVLRTAFNQVGIGLLIGIPLVFGIAKLISAKLYGISAFNLPILIGAIALLLSAAAIASLIPARRAASVDPMQALRTE
jgi:macrolide transport system ATP-binding/permease protein